MCVYRLRTWFVLRTDAANEERRNPPPLLLPLRKEGVGGGGRAAGGVFRASERTTDIELARRLPIALAVVYYIYA